MRYLLTLILTWILLISFGQDIRKVVSYHSGSKQIKEIFYVFQNNNSFKQGRYVEYYRIREDDYLKLNSNEYDSLLLKTKGEYQNGMKQGSWTLYNRPIKNNNKYHRGTISEQGVYEDDKKIGIWQIHQDNIIEQYDYDRQKYIEPIISFFLSYPPIDIENEIEGDVIVGYNINSDCSFSNIQVISGHEYLTEEAINYVKFKENLYKKYMIKLDSCAYGQKTDTLHFKMTP
jgi:hypothetical protein